MLSFSTAASYYNSGDYQILVSVLGFITYKMAFMYGRIMCFFFYCPWREPWVYLTQSHFISYSSDEQQPEQGKTEAVEGHAVKPLFADSTAAPISWTDRFL